MTRLAALLAAALLALAPTTKAKEWTHITIATDIYIARFTPMRHTVSGSGRKTVMKLVVDQQDHRILGAHMLGDDAPEIVQGLAVAITAGATKADFDQTVGIHPTAAEEFVTLRTRTRVAGVARAAE